jgi:hypothetical protein
VGASEEAYQTENDTSDHAVDREEEIDETAKKRKTAMWSSTGTASTA